MLIIEIPHTWSSKPDTPASFSLFIHLIPCPDYIPEVTRYWFYLWNLSLLYFLISLNWYSTKRLIHSISWSTSQKGKPFTPLHYIFLKLCLSTLQNKTMALILKFKHSGFRNINYQPWLCIQNTLRLFLKTQSPRPLSLKLWFNWFGVKFTSISKSLFRESGRYYS